jgi:hypothetical protein
MIAYAGTILQLAVLLSVGFLIVLLAVGVIGFSVIWTVLRIGRALGDLRAKRSLKRS